MRFGVQKRHFQLRKSRPLVQGKNRPPQLFVVVTEQIGTVHQLYGLQAALVAIDVGVRVKADEVRVKAAST